MTFLSRLRANKRCAAINPVTRAVKLDSITNVAVSIASRSEAPSDPTPSKRFVGTERAGCM